MKPRTKSKTNRLPDVRPLNEREKQLNTRKGMIKHTEMINRTWLEKQMDIFFS